MGRTETNTEVGTGIELALSRKDEQPATGGYGVAVDMGASHVRFVLASTDGQILEEVRDRAHSEAGPHAVIAQIREGIARLIARTPEHGRLRGIAIGVPGGVDPRSGKVLDANNIPGWREVDMGRALEEVFLAPVFLDNDANMAAIGEYWRGVARGIENFVFIALGTGIGAGIFVDGRICRGRNGFAGELFRMNLEWSRWNEDFPDTGYLEAHVAGRGLAAEGRTVVARGNGAQASTLAEQRDARYLFDALHRGDPGARALLEKSFVMLGVGVANVVSVLDPELIVFNGGIVQGAPDFLLETVGKVVRRIHPKPPRVELSTLGDKAQIWGALRTVLDPGQQAAIRAARNSLAT
jgi:glucokinase